MILSMYSMATATILATKSQYMASINPRRSNSDPQALLEHNENLPAQWCHKPKKQINFVGLIPFVIMLPKNDRNEFIGLNKSWIRSERKVSAELAVAFFHHM